MNLNKVILIGRLVRDPEIKSTTTGQSVCNFSIATSRFWIDKETKEKKEKTEFHNIVAWGRQAEIINQYLNKGSLVLIEGRLETRSWQDSTENKRYRTEIIAERVQLGPKGTGSHSSANNSISEEKEISSEKIPIIEEGSSSDKDSETQSFFARDSDEEEEEEIDIKKIPF